MLEFQTRPDPYAWQALNPSRKIVNCDAGKVNLRIGTKMGAGSQGLPDKHFFGTVIGGKVSQSVNVCFHFPPPRES